ncbi:hypothetical protein HYX70_03260 [Candidatus Saccharibacteria bacterium]|nr:hypothetical protein [Candidatus Saccharibacteria bacterium]
MPDPFEAPKLGTDSAAEEPKTNTEGVSTSDPTPNHDAFDSVHDKRWDHNKAEDIAWALHKEQRPIWGGRGVGNPLQESLKSISKNQGYLKYDEERVADFASGKVRHGYVNPEHKGTDRYEQEEERLKQLEITEAQKEVDKSRQRIERSEDMIAEREESAETIYDINPDYFASIGTREFVKVIERVDDQRREIREIEGVYHEGKATKDWLRDSCIEEKQLPGFHELQTRIADMALTREERVSLRQAAVDANEPYYEKTPKEINESYMSIIDGQLSKLEKTAQEQEAKLEALLDKYRAKGSSDDARLEHEAD